MNELNLTGLIGRKVKIHRGSVYRDYEVVGFCNDKDGGKPCLALLDSMDRFGISFCELDAKVEFLPKSLIEDDCTENQLSENDLKEQVRKETAKEIYKFVYKLYKDPELDPLDAHDCNALVAFNQVLGYIKNKHGVEVDE